MTEFHGRDHSDWTDDGYVVAGEPLLECPTCDAEISYGYSETGEKQERHVGTCDGGHRVEVSWVPSDTPHPHDAFGFRPVGHDDDEDEKDERVGKVFVDRNNGDKVIVTNVTTDRADEHVVTHDYNKDSVTVDDFDGNDPYPSDDTVVEAVYLDDKQEYDDPKEYSFPISRLEDPDDYDGDDDEPDTPSGQPSTHDELAEITSDDEESDELTKSEFFTRHYFRGRKRADRVPTRMRSFRLVCNADSQGDTLDLLYENGDELVRLTRNVDDNYDVFHSTDDEENHLGEFSSSSEAVEAAAKRMARYSDSINGDAQ